MQLQNNKLALGFVLLSLAVLGFSTPSLAGLIIVGTPVDMPTTLEVDWDWDP